MSSRNSRECKDSGGFPASLKPEKCNGFYLLPFHPNLIKCFTFKHMSDGLKNPFTDQFVDFIYILYYKSWSYPFHNG